MTPSIVLLMPLISSLTLLCQHCFNQKKVNRLTQLSILIAFLISLVSPLFTTMPTASHWVLFNFASRNLTISFYYDVLTWVMLCTVSFISLMIHSYAARYLLSDPYQKRFMAQLSLLTFSVMLLTISGSLFTAFIAWQFIGLSLYLLLNHYHYDVKANKAAKKKFIINRVGDVCFLLAVVIALYQNSNTEFSTLFSQASNINPLIPFLIIIAIMTKSAQFPFHLWLIDTMEAPTPVSALMHAGVINAGGFLLARLSPLYDHFSYLLFIIFIIGFITAILGNFFMQHQADIKKQLAYSTMGQMGYMLMQCGLGCFASAVFHLIAHGFFKATLFLSSGSTLEQANYYTNQPQEPLFKKTLNTSISLLLTVLLIVVGIKHFSKNDITHLNPLLWFFIAITLYHLINTGLQKSKQLKISCLLITSVIGIFFIYLTVLRQFNIALTGSIAEISLTSLGWTVIICLFLIIALVAFYIKRMTPEFRIKLFYKLYLLGSEKGNIENYYRQHFINPIRQLGDNLLNRFIKINFKIKTLILIVLFAYFILSIVSNLTAASYSGHHSNNISLFLNLFLLLLTLIIANRIKYLSQLSITLVLAVLAITSIAFSTNNQSIQAIGCFQAFNALIIIAGFSSLLLKRKKITSKNSFLDNHLPWSHFYMCVFLMLLIGIPGTTSFVSELYLLYGLVQVHFVFAIMLGIAMLLLALVILHTLQEHFFNPRTIKQYAAPLPLPLHFLCLFIIGFNLFNGLYPVLLLHGLSKALGG